MSTIQNLVRFSQPSSRPRIFLMLISGILTLHPTLVHAEEPESSGSSRIRAQAIEEIVVTATKREKFERDIPASMDVFTGDELQKEGIYTLEEIIRRSPGVEYAANVAGADSSRVVFRGIETQLTTFDGPQTFGIFLDTIPLINPSIAGSQPSLDVFDMRTVEVLKGPQGTLYGAAALGGAVRFVPNYAELDDFNGKLFYEVIEPRKSDSSYKDDQNASFGAALNLPAGDRFAIRGAYSERNWPGVYDNTRDPENTDVDFDKSTTKYERITATFNPIDSLFLTWLYQRIDLQEDDLGFSSKRKKFERDNTMNAQVIDSEVDINGGKFEYDAGYFSVIGEAYSLKKDRFSLLAFTRALFPPGGDSSFLIDFITQSDADMMEVRLVSDEPSNLGILWGIFDDWNWLVGAFQQQTEQFASSLAIIRQPLIPDPLPDDDLPIQFVDIVIADGDVIVDTEEEAVFFDLNRTFRYGIEVNIGGRYFETYSEETTTNRAPLPSTIDRDLKETGFNPKYSVTWHARDSLSFYATAAKGFRFGGPNVYSFSQGAEEPDGFDSDSLWNYEIGMRSEWFSRNLVFDITAFQIDWSDLQIIQQAENGLDKFTSNIGSAQVDGVEMSLRVLPGWNFALDVNGAYVDARITEDFQSVDGLAPKGKRLPASSEYTGSINLSHHAELFGVDLTSSATYNYKSESRNKLVNYRELGSLSTIDVSFNASLYHIPMSPTLRISVTNIRNHIAASNIVEFANPSGTVTDYVYNRPRTLSVGLHTEF